MNGCRGVACMRHQRLHMSTNAQHDQTQANNAPSITMTQMCPAAMSRALSARHMGELRKSFGRTSAAAACQHRESKGQQLPQRVRHSAFARAPDVRRPARRQALWERYAHSLCTSPPVGRQRWQLRFPHSVLQALQSRPPNARHTPKGQELPRRIKAFTAAPADPQN